VRWLVAIAAPAYVDDEVGPAVDRARRRWDASHPSDYSFELRVDDYTGLNEYHVSVANGQRNGIERTDGLPLEESWVAHLPGTIEEVFDAITEHLDRGPDLVIAGIHPRLSYPTDATFDHMRNAVDDEFAIAVVGFETA
jgi:hypothetical protein